MTTVPLLSLPAEILIVIVLQLVDFTDALILSQTCEVFLQLIKNDFECIEHYRSLLKQFEQSKRYGVIWSLAKLKKNHPDTRQPNAILRRSKHYDPSTKSTQDFILAGNFLPCYLCNIIKPAARFFQSMTVSSYALKGCQLRKRLCLDCFMEDPRRAQDILSDHPRFYAYASRIWNNMVWLDDRIYGPTSTDIEAAIRALRLREDPVIWACMRGCGLERRRGRPPYNKSPSTCAILGAGRRRRTLEEAEQEVQAKLASGSYTVAYREFTAIPQSVLDWFREPVEVGMPTLGVVLRALQPARRRVFVDMLRRGIPTQH